MPRASVVIKLDPARPELAPAAYLALLAYPDDPDQARAFMWAAVAEYLRGRSGQDPDWGWQARPIEPALLLRNAMTDAKAVSKGFHIITKRMRAAEIGSALILDSAAPHFGRFTVDGRAAGSTNMAEYVNKLRVLSGPKDPEQATKSILNREWRPTLPVLHLAVALRGIILGDYPKGAKPSLVNLLTPGWVERAVPTAEALRILICENVKIRVAEAETIRVGLETAPAARH